MEDFMLRAVLVLLVFGALASCGADGAPVAPGVTVQGTASAGVAMDGG
jgi:hypothetical protein